ncbi:uncharacterized protein LOC116945655 [Petromyzon marinus]|uniref:uncharacterized protein LOC116945655 n=1 Tax=Petromyzon marinus TaxID=7757 RepID=UPI003F6F0A19
MSLAHSVEVCRGISGSARDPPNRGAGPLSRNPLRPLNSAVCRNLFGGPGEEGGQRDSQLRRELCELAKRDCERWGFDFERGTPLSPFLDAAGEEQEGSRYAWEKLDARQVPTLYWPTIVSGGGGGIVHPWAGDAGGDDGERLEGDCSSSSCSRRRVATGERDSSRDGKKRRSHRRRCRERQPHLDLTDYFVKRRYACAESGPCAESPTSQQHSVSTPEQVDLHS